jgi:hypothetical protein
MAAWRREMGSGLPEACLLNLHCYLQRDLPSIKFPIKLRKFPRLGRGSPKKRNYPDN